MMNLPYPEELYTPCIEPELVGHRLLFRATYVDLPGCLCYDETIQSARDGLREVFALHTQYLLEQGLPIPKPFVARIHPSVILAYQEIIRRFAKDLEYLADK